MENKSKKPAIQQKSYTGLIISIAVFLAIVVGIFILSNYTSKKTALDNEEVNLTSHMRDSIQSISRDLFDMKLSTNEAPYHPHTRGIIASINTNSQFLSSALAAFQNGGTVTIPNGETIDVPVIVDPEIREVLEDTTRQWQDFTPYVQAYTKIATSLENNPDTLENATVAAQVSGRILYDDLAILSDLIHERTHKRARVLELAQLGGIGLAILYFIIFIFFFVRRLRKTDREIAAARQETTEIMDTIHEGLFLIDEDLNIGQQTSAELAEIVPDQEFSGQQLETVLEKLVGDKDIGNTRRFIKQLFNERIDEQLITGLNPLQRVQINIKDEESNDLIVRYVRFVFTRVWDDDSIKRVLVSINDITESVRLEERLEQERINNEQQVEMLTKILQISPPLLASFLRNASNLTQNINAILRRPERKSSDLKAKAREIYRDIHSFKGESSALGLDRFVNICETVEDRLKLLLNQSNISGDDFLQVTIALDELIERIEAIDTLQTNLQQVSSSKEDNDQEIKQYYKQFAHDIAERNNKSVELDINQYDFSNMDGKKHDQIKEIVIQLIRNAIVHGIEPSETRRQATKNTTGHLTLSLVEEADGYRLNFSDDGAGIDYQALRNKAKRLPKYQTQPQLIDNMSQKELSRLIFTSGLSTFDKQSSDAGRGMGMDVIKEKLRLLNGKVSLRSEHNTGTKFNILIPR